MGVFKPWNISCLLPRVLYYLLGIFKAILPHWSWVLAGSHHGRFHPWQRSCGEDLTGKGGWGLEGFPGPARACTPKPKSVCLLFTMLCLSTTLLILAGGYPQPPFSGENQLRALVDKSLGHERNVSIQTPSDGFLACLAGLSRLLQLCIWLVTNHDTGSLSILKL